jgi:hypothetical protein
MTSLDDHLRELFASSGPDAAELQGDVRDVRARLQVRRRTVRRRAALVAVAAAVVAGGVFLVASPHRGDDVIMPATSTRPDQSTTSSTAGHPSTTDPTQTTSSRTSSSTTPPNSETSAPPAPSIHDIALGEATYAEACSGDDQHRSAALHGGSAQLPIGPGSRYEVSLGPVGYGDADGDGHEDAVLLLRCDFVGATSDSTSQLRAYRATDGGSLEQVGSSQDVGHVINATTDGLRLTVDVDVFEPTDPACCPSSSARQVWRFDGRRFVLDQSTTIAVSR